MSILYAKKKKQTEVQSCRLKQVSLDQNASGPGVVVVIWDAPIFFNIHKSSQYNCETPCTVVVVRLASGVRCIRKRLAEFSILGRLCAV